jgi:hypothetical protein
MSWLGVTGLGLMSRYGCQTFELGFQVAELLAHVADQVGEVVEVSLRLVCAPVRAPPSIGGYPRGTSSGAGREFRLVSRSPSGAKVLRAKPAVIAGRAYGLI